MRTHPCGRPATKKEACHVHVRACVFVMLLGGASVHCLDESLAPASELMKCCWAGRCPPAAEKSGRACWRTPRCKHTTPATGQEKNALKSKTVEQRPLAMLTKHSFTAPHHGLYVSAGCRNSHRWVICASLLSCRAVHGHAQASAWPPAAAAQVARFTRLHTSSHSPSARTPRSRHCSRPCVSARRACSCSRAREPAHEKRAHRRQGPPSIAAPQPLRPPPRSVPGAQRWPGGRRPPSARSRCCSWARCPCLRRLLCSSRARSGAAGGRSSVRSGAGERDLLCSCQLPRAQLDGSAALRPHSLLDGAEAAGGWLAAVMTSSCSLRSSAASTALMAYRIHRKKERPMVPFHTRQTACFLHAPHATIDAPDERNSTDQMKLSRKSTRPGRSL